MILVHVALHKSQAVPCPIFSLMNVGKRVKEIAFKNGIGIAEPSDKCISEPAIHSNGVSRRDFR